MKNLSRATVLHVLPPAHRPADVLPFPKVEPVDEGPAAATARSLARRLGLVLHDLGLDAVLPAGWVTADGAALTFGALDVRSADRLVRRLEDLAVVVDETIADDQLARRSAGRGQTSLFGGGR